MHRTANVTVLDEGTSGIFAKLGQWELESRCILAATLSNEHTFVDLGAHTGPYTLFAAAIGVKRVLAVEADTSSFAKLVINTQLNAQTVAHKVSMHNLAISNVSGITTFMSAPDRTTSRVVGFGNVELASCDISIQCRTVPTMTWADYSRGNQIEGSFVYIKMDIEGAEATVLPSMMAYIREHQPSIQLGVHGFAIHPDEKDAFCTVINSLRAIYGEGTLWKHPQHKTIETFTRVRYSDKVACAWITARYSSFDMWLLNSGAMHSFKSKFKPVH